MTNQTIDKMNKMHLRAMSTTYSQDIKSGQTQQYTTDEYLSKLVEEEWLSRQDRKTRNLKKNANFRLQVHPLNIDYSINRSLDKMTMQGLLTLDFMRKSENIIFVGSTGTGKSYLAQCIGTQACDNHVKVIYTTMSQLADTINTHTVQGTYQKWMTKIKLIPLLIIDDFGLTALNDKTRKALIDIVDHRYDKLSIILISQIPVKDWHGLIGEETVADAILDRIIHNSHRIQLTGESIRAQKKKNIS
jgi:DNA replication protein DnaC